MDDSENDDIETDEGLQLLVGLSSVDMRHVELWGDDDSSCQNPAATLKGFGSGDYNKTTVREQDENRNASGKSSIHRSQETADSKQAISAGMEVVCGGHTTESLWEKTAFSFAYKCTGYCTLHGKVEQPPVKIKDVCIGSFSMNIQKLSHLHGASGPGNSKPRPSKANQWRRK